MMHSKGTVTRKTCTLVCTLALLLGAGPVMAQLPPPSSPSAERPSAPTPSVSSVEGTVKKVDAAGGKVEIAAGLFGFFGRTLDVTPETQIQVEGRQSSLSDVREGDKVRASYEAREGQSVAKSINVMPERRRGSVPGTQQ